MNTHVRERESYARLFIEVTPELRRVLAEVAEAAINALDQIDGDPDLEHSFGDLPPGVLDDAEPDADAEEDDTPEDDDPREHTSCEWSNGGGLGGFHGGPDDLEDGGDLEPDVDDEPFLGWTEQGQLGAQSMSFGEEDFTDPETSAGFPDVPVNNPTLDSEWRARQAALFDPRLDRRGTRNALGIQPYGSPLPTFPQDPSDRPACDTYGEQRRLMRQAMALNTRRRRTRRRYR